MDLSQEVGLDLLLVCASYVGAHLLRFGGAAPTLTQAVTVLPAIGLLKGAVFSQCQLYRTVWTYAGTPDAVRLVCGSTGASIGLLLGATVLPAAGPPPIALLVIDWLLTTVAVGGWRFGGRAFNRHPEPPDREQTRIVIYGADACGSLLLRHLRRVPPAHSSIVGFVDPERNGLQLRGLPIVDRPSAMDADTLLIPASPSSVLGPSVRDVEQIVASYASTKVSCHSLKPRIVPLSPASHLQKHEGASRPHGDNRP